MEEFSFKIDGSRSCCPESRNESSILPQEFTLVVNCRLHNYIPITTFHLDELDRINTDRCKKCGRY